MRKLLALLLICLSAFLLVACEEDDTVATGTMVDAPNATGAYSESYDDSATVIPTEQPTQEPTDALVTEAPTTLPATEIPTQEPTEKPTERPTGKPSERPTEKPTQKPIVTVKPTATVKPAPTATVKPTTTVKPIPTATVKPLPTAQVTIKPNKELDNIITEKLLNDIEKEFIAAVDRWLVTQSEDDFEDADWLAHFIVSSMSEKYEGHTLKSLYKLLTGKEI